MFIVYIILAGVIVNMSIKTPNTVGGGSAVMLVTIVLAVIFKAVFEYFMGRR